MTTAEARRPGLLRVLSALNLGLLFVCKWISVVLVALIAIIVGWSVIARYVFNASLSWSEDGAKFLMVWLAFIGAPLGFRHGAHVAIDLTPPGLPAFFRRALRVLVHLIVLAIMAVLAWYAWRFAWNGRMQVALTIGDLSMLWIFVCMPIGAAIMALLALEQLLAALLGLPEPWSEEAEAISTQGM